MDSVQPQFIGAACGSHGPYTFYKAVKFNKDGQLYILKLGEFFFMKILDEFPVCIGEIQLLWEEKGTNQLLTSVRLYFKPQDAPGGLQDDLGFGEDEVLAMSEKLIVSVEDLVARLQPSSVPWNYGLSFQCYHDLPTDNQVITDGSPDLCAAFTSNSLTRISFDDVEKEMKECDPKQLLAPVAVMAYPQYCRYRTVLKRIEGDSPAWLKNVLVMAIGGLSSLQKSIRVMFCREVFDYRDLEDLDFHLEHLAPNLKGRPRKRKLKKDDSDSNGYGSDHSSNTSTSAPKVKSLRIQNRNEGRNGITTAVKRKVSEEERLFLKKLYKFMATRNSPIDRLPSLGFKQIDLYALYKTAKRLGGYTKICENRQWKFLYDELGGHASNTSAATCTRRHYEKLILPYETHLRKVQQARFRAASRSSNAAPPSSVKKETGQNAPSAVTNGQLRDKPHRKPSDTEPVGEQTKTRSSKAVSHTNSVQGKPEKVVKEEGDGQTAIKSEDATRTSTSTSTNTGTGTDNNRFTSQTQVPSLPPPAPGVSSHKVFKVEDLYQVEKKATFVQRPSPLEVPVVPHRMATSIMSPLTPQKPAVPPRQAESPQHRAALPSASSVLKAPSFHPHQSHPPSPTVKLHDRIRKQQQSQQGQVPGQRHHQFMDNSSHLHHQQASATTSLSLSSSSSSSSQKATPAHIHTTPSLSHHLKITKEYLLNSHFTNEISTPLSRDPHVLASLPNFMSFPEPPPAHSNYAKTVVPPDHLPPPHPAFMSHRTHKEMRTNPCERFPLPEQVLSRIHTQHQSQRSMGARQHKVCSVPLSSVSPLPTSVVDMNSHFPAQSSIGEVSVSSNGKDNSGHNKRVKSSHGSGVSSSSKNNHVAGSSISNSIQSGGSGDGGQDAGPSRKDSPAEKMAEALKQQQQSEVLLQSALFGAQFTALPRPAQPAESVPAFVPSLLSPHAAFAFAGQGFTPTSAASPLSLYQHLSPAAQAQIMEEMMRQKAILTMAGSTAPFMMSSVPGAFSQPPTKDTPQK